MRIGFLTQYFPPEMGAPQARLSELGSHFVERGHDVTVLTAMPNYPGGRIFDGHGGVYARDTYRGMDVVRSYIYPTNSIAKARRLASYFSFTVSSAVTGAVALRRLDYLLTESPPLFLGLSGYALSRVKRARWIFNVSDLWPESAVTLGIIGKGRALDLALRLESFCYSKAWLVTGQSHEIVDDIMARHPRTPTYHLSNGVDTSLFRPDLRNESARGLLGPPGSVIAIYAGLHGLAQGLDQILDSAMRLRDLERLRIVLVGDGPEKPRLEERVREQGLTNVTMLPPQPRTRIPELLASADLALVPLKRSIKGAVPSKLYEGMASGLPAVLVSEGEAAEIMKSTGAGIAVPPGDADALAAAIRKLATNHDLRRTLGASGRKAAAERFDRADIARAFIDRLEGG